MKTNIATTKEQSARLLRCGVSADTADMCLSTRTRRYDGTFIAKKHQTTNLWIGYPCRRTTSGDEELENIPAWSLSALCGLLPKVIKVDENLYDEVQRYGLQIYPFMGGWQVDYQYCEDDECHCLKCIHGTDLIKACVKAIEWLTASGHMLKSTT